MYNSKGPTGSKSFKSKGKSFKKEAPLTRNDKMDKLKSKPKEKK